MRHKAAALTACTSSSASSATAASEADSAAAAAAAADDDDDDDDAWIGVPCAVTAVLAKFAELGGKAVPAAKAASAR
jgi:hypothetical protein